MGTDSPLNGANGPLLKERPKVYLCTYCGNEFTELALQIHKQECTHEISCACFVCNLKQSGQQCKKDGETSLISPLSLKIINMSQNHDTRNLTNDSEMQTIELDRKYAKRKSANSFNSNKHFKVINLSKNYNTENLADVSEKYDTLQCHREIYCIVCNMHIFWKLFGTHILQHSILKENSLILCFVCNQSFLLANYYLAHFFVHIKDHDCSKCHCNNGKCTCYAEITRTRCYICLKTFNDIHAVIPHMLIHVPN